MSATKDKFFLIPLGVALIAGGVLVKRKFAPKISSIIDSISASTQSSPSKTEESNSDTNSNSQDSTHSHVHTYTHHITRTGDKGQIPVKKMRPKSGDNVWNVSYEREADSSNLNDVLLNLQEGDVIELGVGSFDISLNRIPIKKLDIKGTEGTKLNITNSYSREKDVELSLENLTLDCAEKYFWLNQFKKVSMNQIKINRNFQVMATSESELTIKNSTFEKVSFFLEEHVKAYVENITMTNNSRDFFRLKDFAELTVKGGVFYNFSSSAFSAGSSSIKFSGEEMKISVGEYAFFGEFNDQNTALKRNEIFKIKSIAGYNKSLNCKECEIHDIEKYNSR